MQINFELAQHFAASKIVQSRDRSADPAGARVQSRGGTDASRELLKAAGRRAQQKAARRDQAGERRGGENPFDDISGAASKRAGRHLSLIFPAKNRRPLR
jgi:hypothetical protein